jgi:predicted nucleic acid-binding protein
LIVVDASVVVVALGEDTAAGRRLRLRLRSEALAAPELLDLEVLAAWRRLVQRGLLPLTRAASAVVHLAELPVQRASHTALLDRCWQLRDTVTAYDAAYVALAEALDVPLLTADGRLARASGPRCAVELVT